MSSSSTMRSLVRSVISEVPGNQDAAAASSHFGDETIQTFFAEVKGLVNAAFGALNDEVKSVPGKSDDWRQRAMGRGLTFMADRSNEGAIINSVVESDDACRSLTNLYFSAMNKFVQNRASKQELMNINFVPFGKFIASLYRQLANDNHMKTTFFQSMSYAEKDAFLADTLRRVMQKSIIWPASSSSSSSSSKFSVATTTVKPASSPTSQNHSPHRIRSPTFPNPPPLFLLWPPPHRLWWVNRWRPRWSRRQLMGKMGSPPKLFKNIITRVVGSPHLKPHPSLGAVGINTGIPR